MRNADKTLAPWWEVRFDVARPLADDVAALLVDGGALGVQQISRKVQLTAAWRAHASMGPSSSAEALGVDDSDELGDELGAEVQLLASYPCALSASEVRREVDEVLSTFGVVVAAAALVPSYQQDTSWAHAWRRHFQPTKVGRRLWIVPSWENLFVAPTGSVVLPLDPGMAFGTGQHPTTALCLRAIERVLDSEAPQRVLDVGCGSGILAMAALALGARAAVLTDLDLAAVRASQKNLEAAGFAARFVAQTQLPAADAAGFDLVMANILAPTLIGMCNELVAQMAPGATLLLSGILQTQADDVVHAYAKAAKAAGRPALRVQRLVHDAWVALTLR